MSCIMNDKNTAGINTKENGIYRWNDAVYSMINTENMYQILHTNDF